MAQSTAIPQVEDSAEVTPEDFGKRLNIAKPKKNGDGSATVSFRHSNSEYARSVLRALIDQANRDASRVLVEEMRIALLMRIAYTQNRLDQAVSLRESAESDNSEGKNMEYLDERITGSRLNIDNWARYAEQTYGTINMLNIEEEIALPTVPVKPKGTFILVLCLLGGGFLGVLVALVMHAVGTRRGITGPA